MERPQLPPELWGEIFQFLPTSITCCTVCLVAKEWKQVVDQESFWELKVREIDHDLPSPTTTWKALYQEMVGWRWDTSEEAAPLGEYEFSNFDRTVSPKPRPSTSS